MSGLLIRCAGCSTSLSFPLAIDACPACGRVFRRDGGVPDFVTVGEDREPERAFYDETYRSSTSRDQGGELLAQAEAAWHSPDRPENRLVLEMVGDLRGKDVLLIGNGESFKELHFLSMAPANLVYSDLSPHGLENLACRLGSDGQASALHFCAIDAHEIPFVDDSFDVVYGFAMVHHLPDRDRFFRSVLRVLRPNGRTIFMDDAFAPLWHYSKQTWLRPVMQHSHRSTGISPEDYRFSMTGGFKESELHTEIRQAGGTPWFERTSFVTYLVYRAAEKLLPPRIDARLRQPRIAAGVHWLDERLCSLKPFAANRIRLVWGFTKPAATTR